jgi:hypothetical protein
MWNEMGEIGDLGMKHNLLHGTAILVFLAVFLAQVGCGLATPEAQSPEEIIALAIERTANLNGFAFLMVRDGSRAYLDPFETIALRRIEGEFVAPDMVQATVRVVTPGMVTEFQIISLGEEQWFTNLITGEWEVLPDDWGFNPASLFEPESGIVSVLRVDLSNLVFQGIGRLDEIPGKDLYHIAGDLSGENLYYVSYGLIASEIMPVELWIDPGTYDIHRIVLTELMPQEDEPRIWTLDFWDFDQSIEIAPPDLQVGS